MGNSFQIMFSSDPFPKMDTEPTFDPMFGFKGERKKRGKYILYKPNL